MAGIEAGSECERLAPLLSKLADGEATADDLTALRPHIRTCLACRAALRGYRAAPRTAAALVPPAAFAAADRSPLLDVPARLVEGIAGWTQKAHAATEMASAQKVAAVAASTAVIAGGGAAVTVEQIERRPGPPKRAEGAKRAKHDAAPPDAAAPVASAPPPVVATPPPRAPSAATRVEQREREANKKTPAAQQEFEPAWAAGEPAPTTSTTATASTSTSDAAPASTPTRSRGGAEEFAP